ncbi:SDR family NAD(P)-dependent oxidoreductase [Parvibium lacunae]|uniref:SDR family NAD(P)-dependent oxidoreductase n=1 Tax=Parvibium lacunae TaxID=1888893 RepID=A0A368L0N5_9BURK|nr:SDR family NAD(P)-dependent oxidoreductase [Parvibium lacunae]RCS57133.1 SDR family NAD(P)-dependent oxidoreductase [Parvibium lacunae]
MNPKIQTWQGRRVWLIGASTGIGAATAQQLLALGARVALSARSEDKLAALAAGTPAAQVQILPLDITQPAQLAQAHAQLCAAWGGVDLYLILAGGYTPMRADSFDAEAARALLELNVQGVFNVLPLALPQLQQQGHGGLGIVSSVAGYRGLPKALVYGPSKAALINLAETLYLDLAPKGIGVYLINPGFVETPLTAQNDFKMPALITPAQAAHALLRGLARGQFEITFPRRFTYWLKFLRLLPYRLYFYLVHKMTGL